MSPSSIVQKDPARTRVRLNDLQAVQRGHAASLRGKVGL